MRDRLNARRDARKKAEEAKMEEEKKIQQKKLEEEQKKLEAEERKERAVRFRANEADGVDNDGEVSIAPSSASSRGRVVGV